MNATEHQAPLLIRSAVADDAENIAALCIQVWLHTYATDGIDSTISTYVLDEFRSATIRALIADPHQVLLLAEAQGRLLGLAQLKLDASCPVPSTTAAELQRLYVQEHAHGRGIGRRLLAACVERLRAKHATPRFWLTAYHRNAQALGFYAAQGFTRIGTSWFELGAAQHENHVLISPEPRPV